MNTHVLNLNELLTSVELKNEYKIPTLDPFDFKGDLEKIAEFVRGNWQLPKGPIRNLTETLEQAGCVVIWCDFKNIPCGLSFTAGKTPCIFVNKHQPSDRMRFTLAHELGHIVMHSTPSPDMELEADRFASAFLMPRNDIKNDFMGRITLQSLAALKPIWRVSIQSLLMRAKTIGALSDTQSRYLWQQLSSMGLRTHEPPELDFPHEEPSLLTSIFKIHLEHYGFSIEDIAKTVALHEFDLMSMYPFLNKQLGLRLVKSSAN